MTSLAQALAVFCSLAAFASTSSFSGTDIRTPSVTRAESGEGFGPRLLCLLPMRQSLTDSTWLILFSCTVGETWLI